MSNLTIESINYANVRVKSTSTDFEIKANALMESSTVKVDNGEVYKEGVFQASFSCYDGNNLSVTFNANSSIDSKTEVLNEIDLFVYEVKEHVTLNTLETQSKAINIF